MFRTLMIDDEEPVHLAIRALVDWSGLRMHDPFSAYNGQEGLHYMERYHPDIAFVDISMPLMDGVTFLSVASRNHPYCQYIIVSGYDNFEYAQAAIRSNVVDYLLKPVDREELEAALQRAITRLPIHKEAASAKPCEVILSVRDYIDRQYQKDIKIDELAEKFYYSKEYLTRLFNSQFGYSIYQYLLQVRMHKAKEYLLSTQMQIQEIAEAIGYSNANYFAKAFRHRYGMTPSMFREHIATSHAVEIE